MEHHSEHHAMVAGESSVKELLKFTGVIIFILGAAFGLYSVFDGSALADFMRWSMGVFLLTFAGFKFAGYSMFVVMFAGYDIIAKRSSVYAKAFPFIEALLGLLYLLDIAPVARNVGALIVALVSSVGVLQEVYRSKSGIHCACLGNIIKLPLSTVSLVEDLGMAVMAGAMLILL